MANYDSDPTHVRTVQQAINDAGYQPPLVVDGAYGPKTNAGVVWFQKLHGLVPDGIIGDATMAATITPAPGADPSGSLIQTPIVQLQQELANAKAAAAAAAAPAAGPPAKKHLDFHLGVLTPAAPGPAPARKSIGMHFGPAAAPAPAPAPAAAPAAPPILPVATTPAALAVAAAAPKPKTAAVPVTVGALVGAIPGLFVAGPVGLVAGALVGGGGGLGYHSLQVKKAAKVAAEATMHGDYEFGDEGIIAGDIGMRAPHRTLKG